MSLGFYCFSWHGCVSRLVRVTATPGVLTISLKKANNLKLHDDKIKGGQITAGNVSRNNCLEGKAAISDEMTSSSNVNKVSKLISPEKCGEKLYCSLVQKNTSSMYL